MTPESQATIRRLLIEIINVLGPDPYGCPVNQCHGCQVEMAEALRRAEEALKILDGELHDQEHV